MADRAKRTLVAVTLCLILAAGAILASTMGFKINYPLTKTTPSVSKSGTNTLALPYVRRAGLNTAADLFASIEGHGPPWSKIITVVKFLEHTDTFQVYTGRMSSPGANFLLAAGEGLRVQMSGDVNYLIVGTHDPALAVMLDAPGPGSRSGTNDFALPYHATAATANDLIKDIEGVAAPPFSKVVSVSRLLSASDSLAVYTGRMASPATNFALVPGESYRIQMSVTVPYFASHY